MAKLQPDTQTNTSSTVPQTIALPKAPVTKPREEFGLTLQRHLGVVDIAPLANSSPPKESYSKSTITDPVYVYEEARDLAPLDQQRNNDHDDPKDDFEALGVTMGRLGGMVWDKSASSGKLLRNRHFLDFVDTASKIMSSALNSESDGKPIGVFSQTGKVKSTSMLTKRGSFLSESVSRDQMVVVAIAFQPGSTESFAVSYGTGENPGSTLEGKLKDVVLTWNTRRATPVSFQFRYEIHALCFSALHPHFLFGGSAKGHIVLWDTRGSPSPTSVTFPSLNSHNLPIAHLSVVGDVNRNTLISISLDSRICMWNIDDLRHPLASMVVFASHITSARTSMMITASCIPQTTEGKDIDTSRVYLGAPKGELHVASRNTVERQTTASQVSKARHEGSINSIDCHPSHELASVSNLVLTASSDWTCRIWLGDSSIRVSLQDMVLDAKWSPLHPGVFAACDASGRVTLWNIAHSIQTPIGTLVLDDSTSPGGKGPIILHRLAWDDSGEHIIIGGNQGETFYVAVRNEDQKTDVEALEQWISRNLAISN